MSAENLQGAIAVLRDAERKLQQSVGEIQGVIDGSITDAKELVRLVFAAGFEISGLNQTLGMIEEAENEAQSAISKLTAARAKVEEALG